MTEREKIFARIREGLVNAAPSPGHSAGLVKSVPAMHLPGSARPWLPLVEESYEERLSLFRRNAVELKAEFFSVDGAERMAALLLELRESLKWKKIGVHRGGLTDEARQVLGLPACETDRSYDVNQLESCDVGITECDALIAQTGSVLLTSRSAGGRALSVLPPHHLVLARKDELIADLPDAFALVKRKYAPDYPSFISLITGPSRTGDIERILVLGAHGPRKLTIILRSDCGS
jgi:L-lactate dehydrogenase complex protein LldG